MSYKGNAAFSVDVFYSCFLCRGEPSTAGALALYAYKTPVLVVALEIQGASLGCLDEASVPTFADSKASGVDSLKFDTCYLDYLLDLKNDFAFWNVFEKHSAP